MLFTTTNPAIKNKNSVDVTNKSDVDYLQSQYPWYSIDQIKNAVTAAGPAYASIDKYLKNKMVPVTARLQKG